jgi:hypothetical protein
MVVALATMLFAQPSISAEPLQIKASLSGYNLIWPTTRCCAFELTLNASGKGVVIIHDKRGETPRDNTIELNLSGSQVDALLKTISNNQFFSLPASVGNMPIDDDVRRIEITLGSKAHKVELNGWPIAQDALDSFDATKRAQITRAAAVWSSIRQLIPSQIMSLP